METAKVNVLFHIDRLYPATGPPPELRSVPRPGSPGWHPAGIRQFCGRLPPEELKRQTMGLELVTAEDYGVPLQRLSTFQEGSTTLAAFSSFFSYAASGLPAHR